VKAGLQQVKGYTGWANVATAPYQSATHGNRYVNNYANARGAAPYKKFEKAGTMPQGTVLAKDSFLAMPDGKVAVGPLFIMEKMGAGFSKESGDWRYTMIMPDGSVPGMTKGKGAANVKFCAECHMGAASQGHMFFLPEAFRVKG